MTGRNLAQLRFGYEKFRWFIAVMVVIPVRDMCFDVVVDIVKVRFTVIRLFPQPHVVVRVRGDGP